MTCYLPLACSEGTLVIDLRDPTTRSARSSGAASPPGKKTTPSNSPKNSTTWPARPSKNTHDWCIVALVRVPGSEKRTFLKNSVRSQALLTPVIKLTKYSDGDEGKSPEKTAPKHPAAK